MKTFVLHIPATIFVTISAPDEIAARAAAERLRDDYCDYAHDIAFIHGLRDPADLVQPRDLSIQAFSRTNVGQYLDVVPLDP